MPIPRRFRFKELEERTDNAPNGWVLEKARPQRPDERYTLWSNDPKCIGTTYYYGSLLEVVFAVEQIEKGNDPQGSALTMEEITV